MKILSQERTSAVLAPESLPMEILSQQKTIRGITCIIAKEFPSENVQVPNQIFSFLVTEFPSAEIQVPNLNLSFLVTEFSSTEIQVPNQN